MRRLLAVVCLMTMLAGVACAENWTGELFTSDEKTFSPAMARGALALSMLDGISTASEKLENEGFAIVKQANYAAPDSDDTHTCAYTVAQKTIAVGGEERVLLFVTIRGTNAWEWKSNFDIASPEDTDQPFAKGFYLSAIDVFEGFRPIYESFANPIVFITGYSRGAACANLVGMMMDDAFGGEDIYVYTFATPRTIRGERAGEKYDNIFNIVYETDVVPQLPLKAWGYERFGVDITLPGKASEKKRLDRATEILRRIAPTVDDYYNFKHSLDGAGASENGLSAYDFMLWLANQAVGLYPDGSFTPLVSRLMDMVAKDTDFTEIITLLLSLTMNDMTLLMGMASRHMPNTYAAELEKYLAQ